MKLRLKEDGSIEYDGNGNLPPGIYEVTIDEIEKHYSFSPKRKELIRGLKKMLAALRDVGCENFYLDGSFITNKLEPGDYDACWDISVKIDWDKVKNMYPELMEFSPPREEQKKKYCGEAFLSQAPAGFDHGKKIPFIDFFQKDRTGTSKGILLIKL
ncbi:DUF6932 family protein [uncultured Draconibacterium sp.]|uniref:DUF6932 family protein n=1 Tax=uncultured Draconibacterium sp. TaxID=1573823 RepID=UPI0029C8B9A4|nr:hypothetical protein [uncultured Draconibacterium sp.]